MDGLTRRRGAGGGGAYGRDAAAVNLVVHLRLVFVRWRERLQLLQKVVQRFVCKGLGETGQLDGRNTLVPQCRALGEWWVRPEPFLRCDSN